MRRRFSVSYLLKYKPIICYNTTYQHTCLDKLYANYSSHLVYIVYYITGIYDIINHLNIVSVN